METKPLHNFSGSGFQNQKSDYDKVRKVKCVLDDQAKKEETENESGPSMIIGIDGGGGGGDGPEEKKAMLKLTEGQLKELKLQVIIYEYIASGLPVPCALLLPVWASFGFPQPDAVMGYNHEEFEWGRCRRTDGKKWRCRKNVVTGQKYCERHMHRGRSRSRKPVESSSAPTNSNLDTDSLGMTTTAGVVSVGNATVTITTAHMDSTVTVPTPLLAAKREGSAVATLKSCSKNRFMRTSGGIDDDDDDKNGNSSKNANLIDRGSTVSVRRITSATSQGLNFSPTSVLQVQGCCTTYFCRPDTELEPGRCRRTDGKKWRCRRDVVPNEKYCKMHMHRGAKKHKEASQSPTHLNLSTGNSTVLHLQPTLILPKKEDAADLNTELCISISASPQLAINDDVNYTTVGSGSDITISDTMVASCEDRDISS